MRSPFLCLALSLLLLMGDHAAQAEDSSFVRDDIPLISIEDPQRQATEWATCVAVYEIFADIFRSDPALQSQSDQLHQQANGAKVAVFMALVGDAIEKVNEKDDASASMNRISASVNYGKIAMQEWPKTQATQIMAEMERAKRLTGGTDAVMQKMNSTLKVCLNNADGQQAYVDLWRSLAMSGLLEFPKS